MILINFLIIKEFENILIIRFYLNLYNIKYNLHEKEINIQDETYLDLKLDLFHKEDATFDKIVQC